MPAVRDWAGVRQGSLLVIRQVGVRQDGQALWETKCDCGTISVKSSGSLRQGSKSCSVSCGVVKSNRLRTKHGRARSKEHRAWSNAKQRCFNPDNPQYQNYGGRGITMHQAWSSNFTEFLRDVGPAPNTGRSVSLDRINNNGNYEPGNVRWVTSAKKQLRNQRRNGRTFINGKEVLIVEEAERRGVSYGLVHGRWRKGVRGEALFAAPSKPKRYKIGEEELTLPAWAKRFGVNEGTVRTRMKMGDSLENALSSEKRPTTPYRYKPKPKPE